MTKKNLNANETENLLSILKKRFEKNRHRHSEIQWEKVETKLGNAGAKLWSLNEMETTGGEPDAVGFDKATGQFVFMDCSAESPKGRRNVCYDREGLESRKEHRPANSAVDMAMEMGISLLTEDEYMQLQKLESFDNKTSSWLVTPKDVRKHGGAIFGDFRYGRTFIYHNGAQSYYGVRGFRGILYI